MFMGVIWTSPCSFLIQTNSSSPGFRFQWAAYPACLLLTLGVAKSLPTNVPHQSDSDRHIKMQIPASPLTAILSHSLSWEAPTREGITCRAQGLNIQMFPWLLLTAATILPPKIHLLFADWPVLCCFSFKDHLLCLPLLINDVWCSSKTNKANIIILISLDRCLSLHEVNFNWFRMTSTQRSAPERRYFNFGKPPKCEQL